MKRVSKARESSENLYIPRMLIQARHTNRLVNTIKMTNLTRKLQQASRQIDNYFYNQGRRVNNS